MARESNQSWVFYIFSQFQILEEEEEEMEAWRKPQRSEPDNSLQNSLQNNHPPVVAKVKTSSDQGWENNFRSVGDQFTLKLLLPKLGFLESQTHPGSHLSTSPQSGESWSSSSFDSKLETNFAKHLIGIKFAEEKIYLSRITSDPLAASTSAVAKQPPHHMISTTHQPISRHRCYFKK